MSRMMNIRKTIILVCCAGLMQGLPAQVRKKAAKQLVKQKVETETSGVSIDKLMQEYKFEEAGRLIQSEIRLAQKKKLPVSTLEAQAEQARIGVNMLHATEKVTFVDSFVVSRNDMLKAMRLSESSGSIDEYGQLFPDDADATSRIKRSTVYLNEFKDRMFYSYPDESGLEKLYRRDKFDNKWTAPVPLDGLDDSTASQAYPFVLSDGTTLYYASQDKGSLGGYDIYVTRYNTDTKKYLKPENIGMPFNSMANDYLFAIDEVNNLGWFVSDRYQPSDKVCIYVFIPTASRDVYSYSTTSADSIRRLASIHDIALSQADRSAVSSALQRLRQAAGQQGSVQRESDFSFVVCNGVIYNDIKQFKSAKAMQLAITLRSTLERRASLQQDLARNRRKYSAGSASVRQSLKATILKQERDEEQLDQTVRTLQQNIRTEELAKLKISLN